MCIYIYIYIYIYIQTRHPPETFQGAISGSIVAGRESKLSEFRDVVFEDVVFDNNSRYLTLHSDFTGYGVTELLLSNTTSSNTTSLNSRAVGLLDLCLLPSIVLLSTSWRTAPACATKVPFSPALPHPPPHPCATQAMKGTKGVPRKGV